MDIVLAVKILELDGFLDVPGLKGRFRELAHKCHPDKQLGDAAVAAERFQQLVLAYEYVLGHLEELACHFGIGLDEPTVTQRAEVDLEEIEDIFDDIFGFSRSGRVLGYREPESLYLVLEELAQGVRKRQRLMAYETCPDCRGVGAPLEVKARICTHCFGQGFVDAHNKKSKRKVCRRCEGRGRLIEKPCVRCDGFGRVGKRRLQSFEVPVGLVPGHMYHLQARDERSKKSTEIFVEVKTYRHNVFQIDGADLSCEYHFDPEQNHKDQTIYIKTPLDKQPLTIPAHIDPGTTVTISQAGLYKNRARTQRGHLKVILKKKKKTLLQKCLNHLKPSRREGDT